MKRAINCVLPDVAKCFFPFNNYEKRRFQWPGFGSAVECLLGEAMLFLFASSLLVLMTLLWGSLLVLDHMDSVPKVDFNVSSMYAFFAAGEERQLLSGWSLFLIIYSGLLLFTIPLALIVGSQSFFVSIIHRWSGIITLLLPIPLMAFESIYGIHPDTNLYLFSVITIAFNCIFGGLLIPIRIPKWDIPTIRIFVVAATGGLSFIALSLNFRFGHIPSFEAFGRFLAVLSILSMIYALCDCAHHIHQFAINMKTETAMDLGLRSSRFQTQRPSQMGLKSESPSLFYCFVNAFCARQNNEDPAIMEMVTAVPSNIPVVMLSVSTAFFGMAAAVQFHFLMLGQQGMIYLQETFPKLTQMAVYGTLGAALANNFGAFAGTLVLKKKLSIVQAVLLNTIVIPVPLVAIAVFVARFHRQENLLEFLWNTVSCQMHKEESGLNRLMM